MGWMALVVTSSTLAMYLLLYTAYSKMNKTLEPSLLIAVLTMSEGLEHTLLELNKAISLAGLTVLALAFCPGFYAIQVHLLWHAMILLWTHSCYSAYQFYGGTNIPRLSEFPSMCKELIADDAKTRVRASPPTACFLTVAWPPRARGSTAVCSQAVGMKKLSIILGTAGQLVLSAGYWGYIGARLLCSLRRISPFISPFVLQSFEKGAHSSEQVLDGCGPGHRALLYHGDRLQMGTASSPVCLLAVRPRHHRGAVELKDVSRAPYSCTVCEGTTTLWRAHRLPHAASCSSRIIRSTKLSCIPVRVSKSCPTAPYQSKHPAPAGLLTLPLCG